LSNHGRLLVSQEYEISMAVFFSSLSLDVCCADKVSFRCT
jgi:hypothetical protein